MPRLLAMSFEGEFSPAFDLNPLTAGSAAPDGWGLACYDNGEPTAVVLKEPAPHRGDAHSQIVRAWTELSSSIFLLHVRHARWGSVESRANTQPFVRTHGARQWIFAHGGSMDHKIDAAGESLFEPLGSTDSEVIFCEVLSRIAARRWRNLSYVDVASLHEWFSEFAALGSMSCVLSDGRDVVVYADPKTPMYLYEVLPPHDSPRFEDKWVSVDLAKRGIKPRKGLLVSSDLMSFSDAPNVTSTLVPGGTLLVLREGTVRQRVDLTEHHASHATDSSAESSLEEPASAKAAPAASRSSILDRASAADASGIIVRRVEYSRPKVAPVRTYEIEHRTSYTYNSPVEHSTHMLRLTPYHDPWQRLIDHQIDINVDGRQRSYEDVFGNQVRRLSIESPYTRMEFRMRARVEVSDCDPLSFRPLHARTTIPLVWMPWQRQILAPYLLPPELPESQLVELVDYAMTFVKRNDYDLLETLLDINQTIFREYRYVQGVTSIYTTPFEVYTDRRGVCQDFTNLLICLARLLGVPARYVCGYVYTGPKNPNQVQSDASHAWAQIYLPEVGWKGLDPTNGIITQTEHVRLAVGRTYVDATPTSGTIFVGGGRESLKVEVSVVLLEESAPRTSDRPASWRIREEAGYGADPRATPPPDADDSDAPDELQAPETPSASASEPASNEAPPSSPGGQGEQQLQQAAAQGSPQTGEGTSDG